MGLLPKRARATLAATVILAGCGGARAPERQVPTYAEAIRSVMEQDTQLGTTRNHASENAPIARAVEEYVAGLDALDLEHCPQDFRLALRRHRDAWHDSIAFFEQHAELRGELHDVFDAIRAQGETARSGLEAVEAAIFGTWAEVEQAVNAHHDAPPT